ncbi:Glu-tRNA(Gln) amidotransferase subunit GatE [Candidatus Woesearchaeota archaeon]|nr:Glu-tRNA(Gln) amidotransferase subunit GatE [Candidatus Woesearchaeota archaeon]
MEKLDYKKLGLKCGIEIHQQLDTKKLFCDCKSEIVDGKPDFEVKRELRAVIGETGNIDQAALHEQKKQKKYVYYGYTSSSCLVELDEEPPHIMNKDALEITLQASLLLNARIVDEIQVMRKTVVDGSNTAGFQRTALVARNGFVETKDGKVKIPTISIEEDACKIVKRTKDYDIYNLSRLGIPLIEIGTDPDIKSPEQAKEAAEKLGMILRSTGRVKRGLGTIRQDVNVSIKGGVRTEIKGAQDLRGIPKLVEYEVIRQKNLLKFKSPKTSANVDLSKTLKKTKSTVLRNSLDNKGNVLGIKLEGFSGKLKENIQPQKRLGAELSDFAKATAGVGGLFHSDELPSHGISQNEVKSIKKSLKTKEKDAFIIIADNKKIAEKALSMVKHRLKNMLVTEVRKANDDATTTYLRPMPGAARMYPETDTVPIITDIKKIKLPELIEEKIARYQKKFKLSHDLAILIVKSGFEFEEIVKKYKNIQPLFMADTLINSPKEIKKRYNKELEIELYIDEIFSKLDKEKIPKDAVFEILVEIAHGKKPNLSKYKGVDEKALEKEIKAIVEKNKGASFGALMGMAMAKFRGKVDGQKVSQILKKYAK